MASPPRIDDRGFTETAAVGILLGITLAMILSVGFYVLAVDVDEETTETQFEFDYDGDSDSLLVRYVEGEPYPGDEILVSSDSTEATWAQLAALGPNGTLSSGDALQLSSNGPWGEPVTGVTDIRIHHVAGENMTELANWSANP